MVAALYDLLRRNREFRALFLGAVLVMMSEWFTFVAVTGMLTELTGRRGIASVVQAASVLPPVLLAPIAGVIADRLDRRRVLAVVNVARGVFTLGLLAAASWSSAALALGCVIAVAACAAFVDPVVTAVTPSVVDRADLPTAQTVMGSLWGTMLLVGAALGGLVSSGFGRLAVFACSALAFVAGAFLFERIRRPLVASDEPRTAPVRAQLAEAWAFLRAHKPSRALVAIKLVFAVGNGVVGLIPAFALLHFGRGDAGIGALLAARGLGALVGPVVMRRAVASGPAGMASGRPIFVVGSFLVIGYALAYAVLPLTAGSLELAIACVFCAHVGTGAQWMLSGYGLQVGVPNQIRGRVLGFDYGLSMLALGVSTLLVGASAEVAGIDGTVWGLMAGVLCLGLVWTLWTRDLRRGDLPLGHGEDGPG